MVAQIQALAILGRHRQEDQEFKVILGYLTNLRPAWGYLKPCLRKTKKPNRAGKTTQWLKALAAPLGGPGLVPSA